MGNGWVRSLLWAGDIPSRKQRKDISGKFMCFFHSMSHRQWRSGALPGMDDRAFHLSPKTCLASRAMEGHVDRPDPLSHPHPLQFYGKSFFKKQLTVNRGNLSRIQSINPPKCLAAPFLRFLAVWIFLHIFPRTGQLISPSPRVSRCPPPEVEGLIWVGRFPFLGGGGNQGLGRLCGTAWAGQGGDRPPGRQRWGHG